MPLVSSLGNTGIIWIVLALVLLAVPKTRKAGAVLAAALSWDVVLCDGILKHLFARVRPCDINTSIQLLISRPWDYSFPSGHTAASFASVTALYFFGEAKALESGSFARLRDSVFQIVFICAFSDGYPGRACAGNCKWMGRGSAGEHGKTAGGRFRTRRYKVAWFL